MAIPQNMELSAMSRSMVQEQSGVEASSNTPQPSKSGTRLAPSSFVSGGKAYVGTAEVSHPGATLEAKSLRDQGVLAEALIGRIFTALWVIFLMWAMFKSYQNQENPSAFNNAAGLSVFTAIIFLTKYIGAESTPIGIVNMAMSASLVLMLGYGCLSVLKMAGLGVPVYPEVMVFLVFLTLVIFVSSPIEPSEASRRKVMFGFFAVAAVVHVTQIGNALFNDWTIGVAKMQATCGSVLLLALCYTISTNRMGINPNVVGYGFIMQYFLGMFVLMTETGQDIFKFLGDGAAIILNMSHEGSEFVIGETWDPTSFAFAVLPTTIYFSALTAALTYMGVLQVVVKAMAGSLKKIVGTNAVQSVNAAANMFLGQTEAPLLILPFLPTASPSDIHCVMVGGFASIAGAVLAAYISMGIPASQLLGASVMSVPGTLVISNLCCPPGSFPDDDVERTEGADDESFEFPAPAEGNVVEAAGNGTQTAIALVLNIGAMLISFLSLLALIDSGLGYLGGLAGVPLSFNIITSVLFWPLAFFLGTPFQDCSAIASIIGTKLMVNEFVAYEKLNELVEAGTIQAQSALVATYACCGFANVGSIGIMLGAMATLCPSRAKLFAKVVVRALLAGNIVSWINASYAAVLVNVETSPAAAPTPAFGW